MYSRKNNKYITHSYLEIARIVSIVLRVIRLQIKRIIEIIENRFNKVPKEIPIMNYINIISTTRPAIKKSEK